ncbi:sensor histidine kinase [Paenibacillus sp. sptzw28]|uniref:sensor histidine kinase n=1 Tax=Paenibacillus sp. sptzw28 TaxID=715179 RepID=UPI001C6E7D36|nr:sensor histidine kinase [Paenibacillus sp. sptzw28]QYR19103.1 sensor histidine kinase [Paenibacillus sp. sptzw28]
MSLIQYLKDKRYFIGLYILIMLFVSLIMLISASRQHAANNILYTNVGCFFIAAVYLMSGYYYRRTFYRELNDIIESGSAEIAAALPAAQNYQQAQYLELLKKLNDAHSMQLQQLHNEKRDHQDFIMSWIHEVKLPIAASRLLLENSTGKTVDYLVDKLEDELGKIDNYVEQALYYSRIDSFSKDYFITELELDQISKDSVKKYAKLFIDKHIRFTMSYGHHLVQSDRKWLGFIIDQIVSNCLKYTGEGGEISFRVEEDGNERRLLIQDTGIGIKQEDINRVFDKGFTGSNGRSHAKSTGMGLYLAKRMALKLGHDLSVQSEENSYTKLIIHFPKIRNYYRM